MSVAANDIEMIRSRPGMFIGDVQDGSGLVHLVWEVLANALDEHLSGHCKNISVVIGEDGSVTIHDDGRGIAARPIDGIPLVEKALTSLHNTPTLDGHAPHEHLALFGVGLVAVNALSRRLHVEIHRDGECFRQDYERGVPCSSLIRSVSTEHSGTMITFLPDSDIFPNLWINGGAIAARLRELACLLPSLRLTFVDRRVQEFHEPDGLPAFLRRTRHPNSRVLAALKVNEIVDQIAVEAAIEWRDHYWSSIDSYANIQRTTEGGTHVRGLLTGLARGLRAVPAVKERRLSLNYLRPLLSRGLHAVVCVRLRDPTFESPTRSRLATPAVSKCVSSVVCREFSRKLTEDHELRQHWLSMIEGSHP
ncbi:MAG: ATP-binding protein [Polyangiaceae bacterium]